MKELIDHLTFISALNPHESRKKREAPLHVAAGALGATLNHAVLAFLLFWQDIPKVSAAI